MKNLLGINHGKLLKEFSRKITFDRFCHRVLIKIAYDQKPSKNRKGNEMIVLLVKEEGLPTGMKAAIFFLSVATAFLLGIMWGQPELIEETSKILRV